MVSGTIRGMVTVPLNWYETAFGADYLDRYGHRDADEARRQVDWIEGVLGWSGGERICDACCGAGRHLAELARRGYDAFGFDLSAALLREAVGPRLRADQRHWPVAGGVLDSVIVMFTSLGYFADDAENTRLFHEIARALKPSGGFVVDAADPAAVREGLQPHTVKDLEAGRLVETRRVDGNRVVKDIVWETGGEVRRYTESVRLFEEDELLAACRAAGLEVEAVHPGIDDGTGRLVLVGRRPS